MSISDEKHIYLNQKNSAVQHLRTLVPQPSEIIDDYQHDLLSAERFFEETVLNTLCPTTIPDEYSNLVSYETVPSLLRQPIKSTNYVD